MTTSRPSPASSLTWKPRSYQMKGMKFLLEHACAGLFWKPGRRKTSTTLGAFEFLRKRGMARRMLVLAPRRVCSNTWPREIKKWKEFEHLRSVFLHGPDKEALLDADADIFLINYEGLEWLLNIDRVAKRTVTTDTEKLERLRCDVLVFDELSKVKRHATNRFLALRQVLHLFGRRWGLTGSPAANGLLDLWGQCYCLDMGRSLGVYVSHFQDQYFTKGRDGYTWKLQPGADDRIYRRIAPLVYQLDDAKEDLPALEDNIVTVTLPETVMDQYLKMERDFLTAVEDNVITASTAAVKSVKLRQIAAGGIYHDAVPGKPRTWTNLHEEKMDALADLVDELQGRPLLMAYEFEHDVDRLRKRFPTAMFVADLNDKQFDKVERAWNRGEIPLMFGHPGSIGHGLNLQGSAADVGFISPSWNFDHSDQFIRRVYRDGNPNEKVTVHYIIAAGTIDELVLGVNRGKEHDQNALFAALKQLAKEKRNAR